MNKRNTRKAGTGMNNTMDRISSIDNLKLIQQKLEDLIGTMAVIYEGLETGRMAEESPHCILVLQLSAEQILSSVNVELNRIDT